MVKFLVNRPIAVIMTFIAILALGIVASYLLPISLMPNIDIPEITIQVERPGESAQQIEESIISPMRYYLMQVPYLDDIESETHNGRANIKLRFSYGADINYAFIDVNEKMDEAMRNLPSNMQRPAIIKATATDLPVFYINIWIEDSDKDKFIELSNLTKNVIIKRFEQLPEVAMVDMTGQTESELFILPNEKLIKSLNISYENIIHYIEQNNLTMGSIEVKDGQYRFNIRFKNSLRTAEDVRNIRFKVGDRMMQLGDIAEIGIRPKDEKGIYLRNNEKAISLAVIKQADARMDKLKEKSSKLLEILEEEYKPIKFEIVRDQTSILDYSINNLKENLIFGGLLAFFILFFFLKDARSPWLIGISVPVSLIISLLFFHIMGLSINIISLSGLILGIGMIIDSSIIVIDNITYYTKKELSITEACIKGTTEVIRPLLSSVLTTCSVFIPLIFISGISGALFYDQAIAVSIGLLVSLIVSVTLTPVLYRLFNKNKINEKGKVSVFLEKINLFKTESTYEKGFDFIFKHKFLFLILFSSLLIPSILLGLFLKKETFPDFTNDDIFLSIDWNKNINLDENNIRIDQIINEVESLCEYSNSYVGTQNFILHKDIDHSITESKIYFKCKKTDDIEDLQNELTSFIKNNWNEALFTFSAPETIFEKLFEQSDAILVVKMSDETARSIPLPNKTTEISNYINNRYNISNTFPPSESYIEIKALQEQMTLYNIDYQSLINKLKSELSAWQIGILHTGVDYIPIVIGTEQKSIEKLLQETKITNSDGDEIPLSSVITTSINNDYKTLYGNAQGAYVPIDIKNMGNKNINNWIKDISRDLKTEFNTNATFSGDWFSSKKMIKELAIIIMISIMLLYFILAAQFESLIQPVILLVEIPIDISAAFFMLWIFGGSINIMSLIGIVVMAGIVINDSILKVDTINRLRKDGMPLVAAIRESGHRRLNPIIMTSITTIVALLPVLWGGGMGSEMQKPLALTIIGSMTLGTIVSLYFIPLLYYFLYRKEDKTQNK